MCCESWLVFPCLEAVWKLWCGIHNLENWHFFIALVSQAQTWQPNVIIADFLLFISKHNVEINEGRKSIYFKNVTHNWSVVLHLSHLSCLNVSPTSSCQNTTALVQFERTRLSRVVGVLTASSKYWFSWSWIQYKPVHGEHHWGSLVGFMWGCLAAHPLS